MDFVDSPSPDFIRGVFTHPEIWPFLCDDSGSDPESFVIHDSPLVNYVRLEVDGDPIGCLMLVQQNAVTLELHSALLPGKRGKFTNEAFTGLLAHLRDVAPTIRRLRTWVPAWNRAALVAAKRVGFKEVGIEPGAFLKNGVLCDLHLFGVSL